jgi:hypothetical protein
MRRGLEQFDQFTFGELFFLAHDFGCDALAVDRERNEDRFAFSACDTFATESDIFDFEFDGSHAEHSCGQPAASNSWNERAAHFTPGRLNELMVMLHIGGCASARPTEIARMGELFAAH